MLTVIMEHLEELVAVLLFAIGFTTLLLNRNIIKKIIGFNIMDTASPTPATTSIPSPAAWC